MIKAIEFVRVSTNKQDYERQIEVLDELISNEGKYNIKKEVHVISYKESAIKNNAEEREGVKELREMIEKGGIEDVYVTEISRLARRKDVLDEIKALLSKNNVCLTIKEPMLFKTLNEDKTWNPMSDILFSFLSYSAIEEVKTKSARAKSGLKQRAKEGKVCSSKVVFGYDRDKEGKAIVNNEQAVIVRDIFEQYLKGESAASLFEKYEHLKVFEDVKIKSGWTRINRILKDKTYIGKNKNYTYPSIIDEELFEKVQERIQGNHLIKARLKYIYYCKGLLKLETTTETDINGEERKIYHTMTPKGDSATYEYRDTDKGNKTTSINMNACDSLIWTLAAQAKAQMNKRYKKDQTKAYKENLKTIEHKLTTIANKKTDINTQKNRASNLFIEGKIEKDAYDYKYNALMKEYNRLTKEEDTLTSQKVEIENLLNKGKVSQDWTKNIIDFNKLISVTDDNIRAEIIKETIENVLVVRIDNKTFELKVNYKDTQRQIEEEDVRYRVIRRNHHIDLFCIYDDMFEDWSNGIENRIERRNRHKKTK